MGHAALVPDLPGLRTSPGQSDGVIITGVAAIGADQSITQGGKVRVQRHHRFKASDGGKGIVALQRQGATTKSDQGGIVTVKAHQQA